MEIPNARYLDIAITVSSVIYILSGRWHMTGLQELFQSGDWKKEKHIPSIEVIQKAGKDEPAIIKVSVGKDIPHPNTTEHHIRLIEAYFLPEGGRFPYRIGAFSFDSHGESVQGPDTSTVYTRPEAICSFNTGMPGTVMALSYCNIHGLWQSSEKLDIR